jgi:NAD(P)H-flavin reductase
VLSGASSAKEIRHFEFDLGDSGISYEAGDALGVMPANNPALVSAILQQLGADEDTAVAGLARSLGQELTTGFEISTPSRELIAEVEKRAGHEELSHILRHGDKEALEGWLWGKDTLDLLRLLPDNAMNASEFVGLLKPLQHRAYSISSSPLAAEGRVHLTIASVRYTTNGREHGGVCSTYLADRAEGDTAGIFVSQNKAFRVPTDDTAPVIMVGPGTGIAPFRAFLQERQARGARGRNWLFFGDQHRADDFIYEDELTEMSSAGLLTRLDLAFSRDQSEKMYVQTRMRENGKALYAGWRMAVISTSAAMRPEWRATSIRRCMTSSQRMAADLRRPQRLRQRPEARKTLRARRLLRLPAPSIKAVASNWGTAFRPRASFRRVGVVGCMVRRITLCTPANVGDLCWRQKKVFVSSGVVRLGVCRNSAPARSLHCGWRACDVECQRWC